VFLGDLAANGIIAEHLRSPIEPPLRRLAQLSRRAGLFGQSTLGPRWPHFGG
jgi:hypothetical protein